LSKITTIIPIQNFELIRDRVAQILTDELAQQFVLSGDADNNATVFLERTIPVDKTETPLVNVNLNRVSLETQVQVNTDAVVLFNIDVYHSSKSDSTNAGDQLAVLKLHRLMGICRAILEDPQYKTLGFATPFIMNRHVESLDIAESGKQDAVSFSMGRLVFSVKIPENTALLVPTVAAGFDTSLTLELTAKGYQFIVNAT